MTIDSSDVEILLRVRARVSAEERTMYVGMSMDVRDESVFRIYIFSAYDNVYHV